MISLYNDDCLCILPTLPDHSVDLILVDPPYGTTKCKWDVVIPFDQLWQQYQRLIKDDGAVIIFASEPFASKLRVSNLEWYKYDLYWKKEKPTNFMNLKKRPGKLTENICVFYKNQPTYNPQMVKHEGKLVKNSPKAKFNSEVSSKWDRQITPYVDTGYRYPGDILEFRREKLGSTLHPTQKPLSLVEYLVKTYSNPGDLVLDSCMGSGTTGVACRNLNRDFIGIELDKSYYNIAKDRINDTKSVCS